MRSRLRELSRLSLFSQRLDRAVFASYFLGGIIPLAALAFVVDGYVLPTAPDAATRWSWITALLFLGLLSLGISFALRHLTARALDRMDRDNGRLVTLLGMTSDIAEHPEAQFVLDTTTRRAQEIALADQLAVFYAPERGVPLERHVPGDADLRVGFDGEEDRVVPILEESIRRGEATMTEEGYAIAPFARECGIRGGIIWEGGDDAPDTLGAVATLASVAATALERGDLADAQRNFFAHVTDLIVGAMDAFVVGRDGHADRTARIAHRLAHALELSETAVQRVHFGALLHDIGMLKIDARRHTDPSAFRRHCDIGARLLERIRLWEPVAAVARSHHEWWDGSGYPDQLAGAAIPMEARIVGLADAVDAMARAEPHRRARTLDEILEELAKCSGTQFDPALVTAFAALVERGEFEL